MQKESFSNSLLSTVAWVAFIGGVLVSFRVLNTSYDLNVFLSGILALVAATIVSLVVVFLVNVIRSLVEQNSK